MATQSFYLSVELTDEQKQALQASLNMPRRKKSGDLIYRDTLQIEDVGMSEEDRRKVLAVVEKKSKGALGLEEESDWRGWHINAGLYDLFHSVETLYELLGIIETVKGEFSFLLLGKETPFRFASFFDFFKAIYPKIKPYKENLDARFGVFSVPPDRFFKVRRKNEKDFVNWLGIPESDEKILRLNGWDSLSPDLQKKYWALEQAKGGEKVSRYLSREDFLGIIDHLTILYTLCFDGTEYWIGNEEGVKEKLFAFYSETDGRSLHCGSAEELLKKATVADGRTLDEAWDELTLHEKWNQ